MPVLAMKKKPVNIKRLKQERKNHVLFIVLSKARLSENSFVLFNSTQKLLKFKLVASLPAKRELCLSREHSFYHRFANGSASHFKT